MKWQIAFRKFITRNLSFNYAKTVIKRLASSENGREIYFPWKQKNQDDWKTQPFWHKLMGLFIMRKILQNVNAPFTSHEFLEGVRVAISAVTDAISTQNVENLQEMMSEELGRCYRNAFLTLSEKRQKVSLEIAETKLLNITGVKSVFGKADPTDKHVLKILGQEIVGSKQKLESVIEESKSPWKDSKQIGESAAKMGVTFKLDVKFKTSERFCIEHGNDVIHGSKDGQTCFHVWQFETHVNWLMWDKDRNESYPLVWLLSDVDKFVENNFPENSHNTLL